MDTFNPINQRPVDGMQYHPDVPHQGLPEHMDVRQIHGGGLAEKFRVDSTGGIISHDVEFGKRFTDNL